MASFNSVTLIGNLTRDPEVRYLPSGVAVCELNIAVNSSYFNKKTNQKVEECDFFGVVCWNKTAELAGQYLSKGRSIFVSGRLKNESYEKDGKRVTKTKIVAEDLQFLGGGNSSNERPAAPKQADAPSSFDDAPQGDGDEVPF